MKKALIAVSVAAGLAGIAHAENTTTLFGSIAFQTQVSKDGSVSDTLKNNHWDLDTAQLKMGIKGTEDLNNGLQVFYQMEFGGSDSSGLNETKKAFLGLKGSFGTVTFGKQDSLYKIVTNYNDIFESVYFSDLMHFGAATGTGTLPKAISYVSPDFNGFHFGLAGVLDGSHTVVTSSDSKAFDAYQAGVWYNQNGFYAGLAYSYLDTDPDATKVFGGAVGYSNDQFQVGFGAEHMDDGGEVYNLAGQYFYGPNTFRAGIGMRDPKEGKDVYTYALGYQYNFSKRTFTYVEGEYIDWNNNRDDAGQKIDNGYTVNIGIRHNF